MQPLRKIWEINSLVKLNQLLIKELERLYARQASMPKYHYHAVYSYKIGFMALIILNFCGPL